MHAQKIYILFEGGDIQRETSTVPPEKGLENYFLAYSSFFGVANSGTTHMGGGAGAGKAAFNDFNFTKNSSLNSPAFNLLAASGKRIQKVTIKYVGEDPGKGGGSKVLYTILLEQVLITSVSTSSDGTCTGCAFGMENISLNFGKITWKDEISGIQKTWDVTGNQEIK